MSQCSYQVLWWHLPKCLRNCLFSPPVSDSVRSIVWPAWRRGEGRSWRAGLQGRLPSATLTVVSSPVATWTGTSSHWFQDSCPPSSTCSLCEYPGLLRIPGLPQRPGGPLLSNRLAPAFLEFPTTPLLADSVLNFAPSPPNVRA